MHKIEMTTDITFGEHKITEVKVKPLKYKELAELWSVATHAAKPDVALQRARIMHQTHFMDGSTRIKPDVAELSTISSTLAMAILAAIDIGQGSTGEVVSKGDGATTPIVYKLGTPIKMKSSKGSVSITEIEFMANTYGQLEDVLAADNQMDKVMELMNRVAVPLGIDTLTTMPSWAIDNMTVADGVIIMRDVLPNF